MDNFDKKEEGLEKEPMELYKESKNKHLPIWTGSLLDCLFHVEANKLFNFGEKEPFGFNHLFGVDKSLLHSSCYPKFREIVNDGLQNGKKLAGLVFSTFWKDAAMEIFWLAFFYWSQIPTPYLTKWLLEWLETETDPNDMTGYYYALLICICSFILPMSEALLDNYFYKITINLDLNLKVRAKNLKLNFSFNLETQF